MLLRIFKTTDLAEISHRLRDINFKTLMFRLSLYNRHTFDQSIAQLLCCQLFPISCLVAQLKIELCYKLTGIKARQLYDSLVKCSQIKLIFLLNTFINITINFSRSR